MFVWMATSDNNERKAETTTDGESRTHTVGELNPRTVPVVVTDYDPEWPASSQREAARIRSILGARVRLLEHAGSTAVPDLPAKPIIDIILAVSGSSDEGAYVPSMETAGYVLRIREPQWFEHRMFKGPSTDINLHVFTVGCPEIDQMLLFRDWLRAHPEDRDLYATEKRELARQHWKFVQDYADAKTDIVRHILAKARG